MFFQKKFFFPLTLVIMLFLVMGTNYSSLANNSSQNDVGEIIQEPVFTINSDSSEKDLQEIEAYFSKIHPDLLIKFANVRTGSSGKVLSFDLQLKFKGDSKFHTRLRKTEGGKNNVIFRLQYVKKGPALKIQQSDERSITLLITKDDLRTQ